MRTIAVIQARMGSTRLPGKVLMELSPYDVTLEWVHRAVANAPGIDDVVIATTTKEDDTAIEELCHENGWCCVRGSATDVLARFHQAARATDADILLRLTGDCPFLDPHVIAEVVRLRHVTGAAYASNIHPPTWPDGLDTECFTREALDAAHAEATTPLDRDCVTPFIVRNRHRFPSCNLPCPIPELVTERWVLDTAADWEFCKRVAAHVTVGPSYLDVLRVLDERPDWRKLNHGAIRNERYFAALADGTTT